MNSNELYVAYVDIEQVYQLFDANNIIYGKWIIQKGDNNRRDFSLQNNASVFNEYIFHMKYISYISLIYILKDIYLKSIENKMYENLSNLNKFIVHISKIFTDINKHVYE